ncbi:hypothetical protein [Phenylobacterium sp.]|uniref:hypothetical protein n=1 Tax=Phenylobacterium sp. TaxID=1871053 RepID=UPI0012260822|nr:hypothetical protein [Phenylobacterium sp.]THD62419.1 MAG: hypothetical protein E8A49_07755 [Phenylobacterium sp.]
MIVPPWAGFVADFPDDQVEGGGDIQVFGGRNVAVALGEILASLGCSRVSAPKAAGEMGWEFTAYYEDRYPIFCRLQSFHPVFWLLFEDSSASKKGAVAYVALWRKFGNALEQDPRFHKILWRSFKEGPPDWDEVEATSDSPERAFEEEFPPSKIKIDKPRTSIWPYLIGIWLTASGIAAPAAKWGSSNLFHKFGYVVFGIILFSIGAFFLLIAINQNRETLLVPWRQRKHPKRARH